MPQRQLESLKRRVLPPVAKHRRKRTIAALAARCVVSFGVCSYLQRWSVPASHAVERQRDHRRVYRIDAPCLEPGERTAVADVPESGRGRAEPVAQRPVEPLCHDRIPRPVRVGERVPLRRRNAADPRKFLAVDLGDVHELVEAEGVQELTEHQRVELRGVGELPRLDPLPAGKAFDQMAWQPLDNLGENGYHSPRCLGVRFHNTVHYRTGNASKATFFIAGMTSPMVGSEAIPMSSGTGPMGC